MRIIDQSGAEIESPDLELGHLEQEKILVAHHDALPELPRIEQPDEDNVIEEHLNEDGTVFGRVLGVKVVQEYRPASDAWDEYEDVLRYILYTEEELQAIAERKAQEEAAREEAERQAAIEAEKAAAREQWLTEAPGRLDSVEEAQLDIDEAVTALYEGMTEAQLDTDEALVAMYEMLTAQSGAQEGEVQ